MPDMNQEFPTIDAAVPAISGTELKRRLDAGDQLTLIDTRPPDNFQAWRLTHPHLETINIPFDRFLDGSAPASTVPPAVPDGPLVVSCAIGISSTYVGKYLAARGYDVTVLEDGMEGWATVIERNEIPTAGNIRIFQYHRPSSGCLGYLLVTNGRAALVDPLQAFIDEYRSDLQEFDAELQYAIDTHVHADHVSGVQQLASMTDCRPVYPSGAVERGLASGGRLLGDGEVLYLGDEPIQAVSLPGHTTEMTGFKIGKVLLTGDSLFIHGVARPDLEDPDRARSAAKTLYQTLTELREYPDETIIAPGHAGTEDAPTDGDPATAPIGKLYDELPVLQLEEPQFLDRILSNMPPRPSNYERIIDINLGQETVSAEDAFELELGPNNCAAGLAAD